MNVYKMGGDIKVDDVPDGVTLHTMGGDIVIDSADASVKATTMAGKIDAGLAKGQAPGTHEITLSSNSGDILLTVPQGYPMTIEVTLAYTDNSSQNYKITDNVSLEQSSSKTWDRLHGTPRKYLHAKGRTGNGQNHVIIKIINGNVIIEEANPPQ